MRLQKTQGSSLRQEHLCCRDVESRHWWQHELVEARWTAEPLKYMRFYTGVAWSFYVKLFVDQCMTSLSRANGGLEMHSNSCSVPMILFIHWLRLFSMYNRSLRSKALCKINSLRPHDRLLTSSLIFATNVANVSFAWSIWWAVKVFLMSTFPAIN